MRVPGASQYPIHIPTATGVAPIENGESDTRCLRAVGSCVDPIRNVPPGIGRICRT